MDCVVITKDLFQRTSDLRYFLCVLGKLAVGLTISSLLSMLATLYDFASVIISKLVSSLF